MRLNIIFITTEEYIGYAFAVVGTIAMGLFANYAESKIHTETTNAFGDTISGGDSLVWTILTALSSGLAFCAAVLLIVIAVKEAVVLPLAVLAERVISERKIREAGLRRAKVLEEVAAKHPVHFDD